MLYSRTSGSLRAVRAVRIQSSRIRRPYPRFQSTISSSSSSTGGSNHALIGGIAGGSVALIGGYAWYYFSGAKTLVNTAHETKQYFQTAQKKLTENAPAPNEALKWLRQVSTYYAGFVPGASGMVDTAFNDLDTIHEKHRDEADKIIQDAYNELKQVSNQGLTFAAASQAWEILQKHLAKLGELAGDATEDILNNHPELKKKVGGNLDQLKKMGEQYGPEAKKQVDETWDQIKDITKTGFSGDTVEKVRKLVQDKVEQVQKLGDEAWKKAMEQAKPYLDKNPKIKEVVEENASALKKGNFGQLYEKVKSAADSGSTEDLEKYIKDAAGKAKESGAGGFDQLLKSIPGGDQFIPKIQHLQELAEKHGGEAKKLFDETVQEITQVLSKKADRAKELAKDAEKEGSN